VFGESAYGEEASSAEGWRRFRRVEPAVADIEDAPIAAPSARPIAMRLGPVVAAMLMTLAVLVTTLSVLHGAPSKLPGWALGSPLVYEAARAGLIVLGVAVLSNLLLALASGRLVSKLSPQGGLELDAAALVAESGGSDRAMAAALLALNQRIDTVERTHEATVTSTVGAIAHANDRLRMLTEALAESANLRRAAEAADDREMPAE
jgi:hypothetical protein